LRRIESLLQNRTSGDCDLGISRPLGAIERIESIVEHWSRLPVALESGDLQRGCDFPLAWADFMLRFH
jgi:hypothetical protein